MLDDIHTQGLDNRGQLVRSSCTHQTEQKPPTKIICLQYLQQQKNKDRQWVFKIELFEHKFAERDFDFVVEKR